MVHYLSLLVKLYGVCKTISLKRAKSVAALSNEIVIYFTPSILATDKFNLLKRVYWRYLKGIGKVYFCMIL